MSAPVRIVLIDPSHPGNIGSVARAMKNMALSDLVLVRPRSFPHAEANALAAGADDILAGAKVVSSVAEAIADCAFIAGTTSRPRSYYWEFTTPRDIAARIAALPPETRTALLFGSERYGLANDDLQYCNVLVRIPANPAYCSLNLAMSVQLLSYEIFLAREQPRSHTQLELPLAPSADVEHFYAHLLEVLERDRFRGPHRPFDGTAAAPLQSSATRPQRTEHPARHLEPCAGAARPISGQERRMSESRGR
jgi:tRNA (cytidine32/uridine32-2'-O)-methyltransferase